MHLITGIAARRHLMSGIEANRGQVAAALLQWGAGFEVTQLGSGAPFENDVFGADSIPERGRALAAANPQLSTPDDVLAALSACLHHVRPERHHKQMTMVYSGEISVVQVVLGEEGPRRMWPLCWLYAEHGGTVQEFFAWIAQFAIMDDFTELHLYKMMAACEDECLVCAPGNVWMYLCAAVKALSNSLGEHRRLQLMTACSLVRHHASHHELFLLGVVLTDGHVVPQGSDVTSTTPPRRCSGCRRAGPRRCSRTPSSRRWSWTTRTLGASGPTATMWRARTLRGLWKGRARKSNVSIDCTQHACIARLVS